MSTWLRRRYRQLEQLAGEPISPHTIEMLPHPNAAAPQFYFMVVYTGRSLEPFKKRDGEG
ncbi:MAG: hypothetical protein U0793_18045 [Gemmataceae bacterium]